MSPSCQRSRATLGLCGLMAVAAAAASAESVVVADAAGPCLEVRSLPDLTGPMVDCLQPGRGVELVRRGPVWAEVRLGDGTRGWAKSQYLEVKEELPSPAEPAAEPDDRDLGRIRFDIPFAADRGGGSATGSAESVETVGEDLVVATGGVEFRYRENRLQAQRLEVNRSTREVVAEGEVILDQGPSRLTGSRLEFNLETRTGRLLDAKAFADPDVYFWGDEIQMLGDDVYTLKNGEVTSCLKDRPGWSFRTGSARIRLEGLARMKNTTMRVKGVPLVYLPYIVYPAKSERTAGLLFPNLGFSQNRGSYLGLAWFQPIGPSYDTTFYLDLYTDDYFGFGNEIRYRPSGATAGWFEGYAIEDPLADEVRWKVSWDHSSDNLPLGLRGVVRVRELSDFNFFRDFERDFNNVGLRRVESSGFLTGNWGAHSLNLLLNRNEAFISGRESVVGTQLPEIEYRLRAQQLGRLPIYLDLLSSINYISIERTGLFDESYSRADLYPQITVPLSSLPWLSVSVTGGERVTWYEDSVDPLTPSALGGGSLTRSFPTASADIVGPSFSKVFNTSIGPFAKFKHIFEPRWGYRYIGDFDEQNRVPLFDEVDILRASNLFGYALVNRLLAKPEDEELLGGPREILSFEINQAFSLDDEQPLQSSQDGTITTKEGPLGALLRFNPSDHVSLEVRARYNTLFSNLESTSLSGSLGVGRHGFGLSWFTRYNGETGEEQTDQIRLTTNFEILPKRLTFGSQVNYDLVADFVQAHRHGLAFNGQCWGFRLEYSEISSVFTDNYDIRFALTLKNVGTFLDLTGGSRGGQF